ncbi:hypothetical protein CDAR_207701 [Caerostris darwini]|uniref:Uncharacterized protein n=1 Tax=Caerostris darwini TaxID=1538125 RepID=A0AAV4WU05_9ARAC|nr:hypothetical protein CDAR_207701 [Caerostris darwini]
MLKDTSLSRYHPQRQSSYVTSHGLDLPDSWRKRSRQSRASLSPNEPPLSPPLADYFGLCFPAQSHLCRAAWCAKLTNGFPPSGRNPLWLFRLLPVGREKKSGLIGGHWLYLKNVWCKQNPELKAAFK